MDQHYQGSAHCNTAGRFGASTLSCSRASITHLFHMIDTCSWQVIDDDDQTTNRVIADRPPRVNKDTHTPRRGLHLSDPTHERTVNRTPCIGHSRCSCSLACESAPRSSKEVCCDCQSDKWESNPGGLPAMASGNQLLLHSSYMRSASHALRTMRSLTPEVVATVRSATL